MEAAVGKLINPSPDRREPEFWDFIIFFGGIPLVMGFVFSLVSNGLIAGLPYLDSLLYMILHMLLAWCAVSAGAWTIFYLFRPIRPSVSVICILGFLISMVPTAALFNLLADVYSNLYPIFAANLTQVSMQPAFTFEYIAHFARFSLPAVPLYLAGVLGYRYVTGVDWLGYDENDVPAPRMNQTPMAGRIEGSQLPADAEVYAVKAEQHYVRIWSDQGTDIVRYRFCDVQKSFARCHGAQVHRSWWVNFTQVHSYTKAGRSIDLLMKNEMRIPVSLAHRNSVLQELDGDRFN